MKTKLVAVLVLLCSLVFANVNAGGIPAGFVAQEDSSMYVVLMNFNNEQYTVTEVTNYMKSIRSLLSGVSSSQFYAFGPNDLASAGLGTDADALHNQLVPGAIASSPIFDYVYVLASKVPFLGKTNLRMDIYMYSPSTPTGLYLASFELSSELVAALSGS